MLDDAESEFTAPVTPGVFCLFLGTVYPALPRGSRIPTAKRPNSVTVSWLVLRCAVWLIDVGVAMRAREP